MVAADETISRHRLRPISVLLKVMPWRALHILKGDRKQDGLRKVEQTLMQSVATLGDLSLLLVMFHILKH